MFFLSKLTEDSVQGMVLRAIALSIFVSIVMLVAYVDTRPEILDRLPDFLRSHPDDEVFGKAWRESYNNDIHNNDFNNNNILRTYRPHTKNIWTPLHDAAITGNIKTVTKLIAKGAKMNAKDRNGITALHVAIENNYSDVAVFLLNNGANISIKDDSGQKLLMLAIGNNNKELEALLIEKGAKIGIEAGESLEAER